MLDINHCYIHKDMVDMDRMILLLIFSPDQRNKIDNIRLVQQPKNEEEISVLFIVNSYIDLVS
jgi:hypothetical protein